VNRSWWTIVAFAVASAATAVRADGADRAAAIEDAKLRAEVEAAIEHGVEALRRTQLADGSWSPGVDAKQAAGVTAIALYALAASGVAADDPAITRALGWVERNRFAYRAGAPYATYSASLLLLALLNTDPDAHARRILSLANAFVKGQGRDGAWDYQLRRGKGDPSNTHYALLALWAAEGRTGFKAPAATWERAAGWIGRNQLAEGGWGYEPGATRSYGAMTAANLFGWVASTAARGSLDAARAAPKAQRGLRRLLEEMRPGAAVDLYAAYSLERTATIMGLEPARWYVTVARALVRMRDARIAWGGAPTRARAGAYANALALLTLARATHRTIVPAEAAKPGKTAPTAKFPSRVTESNLSIAFEAYLIASDDERKELAHRFGGAGLAAVEFLLDRLADPDQTVRTVATVLLNGLLAEPVEFDPAASSEARSSRLEAIRSHWEAEGARYRWNPETRRFERE